MEPLIRRESATTVRQWLLCGLAGAEAGGIVAICGAVVLSRCTADGVWRYALMVVVLGAAVAVGCLVGRGVRGLQVLRSRVDDSQVRCLGCGYNLTGNTSGVCPECGTRIDELQIPTVARE